jgi:LacI family transcriptional regulator, repressor for deo operon, udp, cdd, tsx, nupC, and nupG
MHFARKEYSMVEITIKDIAQICGVGVSTVSRAINNHPDINPETKALITKTIKEMNYIPNNSARNLKRIDAKSIAVLVKGITNPFFSNMIKIMEEEIKKRKYSLVLHHVDFNEDEVDVALELVKEKRLRGIVFLGGYFSHAEEKLAKLQVPFVLSTIGGAPETIGKHTYSSISVDDFKESYQVVDYLIKIGHKKIAILSAPFSDISIGKLRLDGYLKAHSDNQIPVNKNLICCMHEQHIDYSLKNGYDLTNELLARKEDFTAVFAISDNMAIGSCKALFDAGYEVPKDYSVIGYDGIEMGQFYHPALTTMAQPIDIMALETIKQLFKVIDGLEEHQHKVFPATLTIRDSVRELGANEK